MKNFRTVEISDPRFESDHLRFITVKSDNLKGRGDICVFVPPRLDPAKPCPVVILLHGVYGSAWTWAHKTGVHLQALKMIENGELPAMVIAMPSDGLWGDGSAYLSHGGKDYERWIADDVPDVLQQFVPGVSTDSPLFIAGLSMGGFGALRIGVKYHHKFTAVAGHSSITNLQQMSYFVEEDLQNFSQDEEQDEDVFQTIIHCQTHLPAIYFDCGQDDLLIAHNRELHFNLKKSNIKHSYTEYPGGHEWPYWEKNIAKSLLFFAAQLTNP